MISKEKIDEAVRRLVKTYNPLKIYLFGSYAWGTPNEDSDLDFLVVVKESSERSYKRPIAGHRSLIGMMIPKDILVYTKDEFDYRANNITTLSYKIKNDGECVYAKA